LKLLPVVLHRCARNQHGRGSVETPEALPVAEPEPVAECPGLVAEPAAETRQRRVSPWMIVAVIATLAAAGVWLQTSGKEKPALTLTVGPPAGTVLTDLGQADEPELSPDGSALLFHAGDHEYVRRLDSPDLQLVPGFEGTAASRFWSPDSRTVFFVWGKNGHRMKVRLPDGPPEAVAPLPSYSRGGSMAADGPS
jgi:hypothetical protein